MFPKPRKDLKRKKIEKIERHQDRERRVKQSFENKRYLENTVSMILESLMLEIVQSKPED